MGRKNRVRHGQFRDDVDPATASAAAAGAEGGLDEPAVAVDVAQPAADAGDGPQDAESLEPVGGDGSDAVEEAAAVSAVEQAGQSAAPGSACPHCGYRHPPDGMCLAAEEVSHGQAQEAPGDGGEDPASSGSGDTDSAGGDRVEPVAEAVGDDGDDRPPADPEPSAADGAAELHSGGSVGHEGADAAGATEPVPALGAEPVGGTLWRKKPVTIEALPAMGTPESNREIIEWTRGSSTPAHMGDMEGDHQTLYISTREGEHRVTPGDWIIRGVAGEHYPCKPEIFKATYEAVADGQYLFEIKPDQPAAAEPVPSAQAWRPATAIDRAAMTAAASMNEAFWVLFETSQPWSEEQDRIYGNYALWRPAGEFVAAHREAPADSIAIHLALKKIGGTMKPTPAEVSLWNVFKTVFLLIHDALVEAERAAIEPLPAETSNIWPGDLAMQPQPSAFDAAGFSPRR